MATTTRSTNQSLHLRKIVGQALTDADFRKKLISNPEEAINSKRKTLRFGYSSLTPKTRSVLSSLTEQDLDSLNQIYAKGKPGGIKPVEMF